MYGCFARVVAVRCLPERAQSEHATKGIPEELVFPKPAIQIRYSTDGLLHCPALADISVDFPSCCGGIYVEPLSGSHERCDYVRIFAHRDHMRDYRGRTHGGRSHRGRNGKVCERNAGC